MKRIFTIVFTACILLFTSYNADAQKFTGGNIGFHFDNYGTTFDASPIIGYRMNKFEVGLAPFFTYQMPKNADNNYLFGNRVFSKYHVVQGFFLHAEFEAVNYPMYENDVELRKWAYGLPLGAGYEQRVGSIRIHASVLYDVLLNPDTGRENPIYRGGIIYDF